jgi:hypothetical protein
MEEGIQDTCLVILEKEIEGKYRYRGEMETRESQLQEEREREKGDASHCYKVICIF